VWFEITKALVDNSCGFVGQTASLSRVEDDGSVYVVLRCGHPLWMLAEEVEEHTDLKLDVCQICGKKTAVIIEGGENNELKQRCFAGICQRVLPEIKKEITEMPKKTAEKDPQSESKKIKTPLTTSKGILPAKGLESEVREYIIMARFLDHLTEQVEAAKKVFRGHALRLWEEADAQAKPKEVRFLGESGDAVPVTMPDPERDSSRRVLPDKLLKQLLKRGVDIHELGIAETTQSVTLTGPWVAIAKQVVQHYEAAGADIPDGFKERESLKLTYDGVGKVKELMANADPKEAEALALLMSEGLKAPTVKID
jgi:hypothetical protein